MKYAGVAIAVKDAHPKVKGATRLVTDAPGGRGAIREVCDWLLYAKEE
jgi:3-deoxy-D-manno-octulosonate 8-phosphate phosphatase (KDO 8-P phosphatase)